METLTEFPMLDETGKEIVNKLHTQNILLESIANAGIIEPWTTFAEIEAIVRSGNASKVFAYGDQINVEYTATNGTKYQMPFDVVHFGDVTLADGSVKPGMFLQSHYATLEGVQFDAPEPNNTRGAGGAKDNNVASYGYDRWSESGIRAWLNSSEAAGNWFGTYFERNGSQVARQAYDVAPDQLASVNGFLRGLDPEFVAILGEVKVQTSCNTVIDGGVTDVTYDKIFLPSLEQMYGTPEKSGVEGDYWPYWKRRLGITSPASYYPTIYENYKTYALESHSSEQNVRLRSANRGYSCYTWNVYIGGSLGTGTANYASRCAPACVII
ncbi:MAG: DUF6273 domain-containing protein [Eubacteriales bacterium]|nr:DUF6273 domain-containing protein [Eubacteriales bacterium]